MVLGMMWLRTTAHSVHWLPVRRVYREHFRTAGIQQ